MSTPTSAKKGTPKSSPAATAPKPSPPAGIKQSDMYGTLGVVYKQFLRLQKILVTTVAGQVVISAQLDKFVFTRKTATSVDDLIEPLEAAKQALTSALTKEIGITYEQNVVHVGTEGDADEDVSDVITGSVISIQIHAPHQTDTGFGVNQSLEFRRDSNNVLELLRLFGDWALSDYIEDTLILNGTTSVELHESSRDQRSRLPFSSTHELASTSSKEEDEAEFKPLETALFGLEPVNEFDNYVAQRQAQQPLSFATLEVYHATRGLFAPQSSAGIRFTTYGAGLPSNFQPTVMRKVLLKGQGSRATSVIAQKVTPSSPRPGQGARATSPRPVAKSNYGQSVLTTSPRKVPTAAPVTERRHTVAPGTKRPIRETPNDTLATPSSKRVAVGPKPPAVRENVSATRTRTAELATAKSTAALRVNVMSAYKQTTTRQPAPTAVAPPPAPPKSRRAQTLGLGSTLPTQRELATPVRSRVTAPKPPTKVPKPSGSKGGRSRSRSRSTRRRRSRSARKARSRSASRSRSQSASKSRSARRRRSRSVRRLRSKSARRRH